MRKALQTLILLFASVFIADSVAQTNTPILTLNTPMHSGNIRRIDVSKDGTMLLTVSEDKTAKVWNTQTGELIRTFRVPIEQGNKGLLNAGAISPNGKIIAVSGWTSTDGNNNSVYFFNVSTGTLIGRIENIKSVVLDMEFSPDGKLLAIGLANTQGVQVYRNTTSEQSNQSVSFVLSSQLQGYTEACHNLAWDRNGRLATVSFDGKVKLFDANLKLVKEISTSGGKQPFTLSFSPDGSLLAIGFSDSPKLQVLDGFTLTLKFEPDITGANTYANRLNKVSFSYDGQYLIAGGAYQKVIDKKWIYILRVYVNQGRGAYIDIPATGNLVFDIKPLPDNSFMFSSGNPDIGRYTVQGNRMVQVITETNLYNLTDVSHFKINQTGSVLGVTPTGQTPISFSLAERNLVPNINPQAQKTSTNSLAGITVTSWQGKIPSINSKPISFLLNGEVGRAADISSDASRIIISASWTLYAANPRGEVLWRKPQQSAVWAVNTTSNNKVVVSLHGDGIIRWWRLSDGEQLLSLFLHPDNRRWILWTPSGYFDCSPGAEEFIGWHMNQGEGKEPLYYPVSRFRSTYHRPDIIDQILVAYSESEAIAAANRENNRKTLAKDINQVLPPTVSIVSPINLQETSSDEITIEFSAVSPNNEPISNVRFLVDGRPVDTQRGFVPVGSRNTQTRSVIIPRHDATIQVMAENQHGWSVPASVSVKWKGQAPITADILKPNLYVLAIGVSDYKNDSYDLKFAAKDATDFATALSAQKGGLYKDVVVRTLTDTKATKDNILDGLDWIQRETTSRDLAMIFLAGHGINDNSGTFFFLPHEANLESIRRTCLMFSELKHTTSTIAGKVVMYVDACHSGNVMGSGRRAADIGSLVNELSEAESGAVVFTSSTGKQFSLENPAWGNGAFTKALVEGLNGKADLFGKGTITIKTLDAYIAQRVKELTGGKQSPTAVIPHSVPDFPIAVKK